MASINPSFMDGPLPVFVQKDIIDKYKCDMCHKLLLSPMQTPCGHRVCESCVMPYIYKNGGGPVICPVNSEDCEQITAENVTPDNPVKRELSRLKVYCTFQNFGCKEIVTWSKMGAHAAACRFAAEDCPNKSYGCSEMLLAEHVQHHLQTCPYRQIECKYCRKKISVCDRENHNQNDCPEASIPCPFKCGEQAIKRKELDAHKPVCTAKPQDCEMNKFGCKFSGVGRDLDDHLAKEGRYHMQLISQWSSTVEQTQSRLVTQLAELSTRSKQLNEKAHHSSESGESQHKLQDLEKTARVVQKSQANLTQRVLQLENAVAQTAKSESVTQHVKEGEALKERMNVMMKEMKKLMEQHEIPQSDDIRTKLISHEKMHNISHIQLADFNLRIECLEKTTYDGVLLWRISNYNRRKEQAVNNQVVSVYSQPFYTHKFGYKMGMRAYLNGDSTGRDTHMSLFFLLMKGDYDPLLPWPFKSSVTISLLDQQGGDKHKVETIRPDAGSSSFKRPTDPMNPASGYPNFVGQSVIERPPYLVEDCIFIKVKVDIADCPNATRE